VHQVSSHHRRSRGYVLVVTLGLLVLAATLLIGIGRASVSHALTAHREQAELQRRWGVVSCRNALLPAASDIIAIQERKQSRPIPVLRAGVALGGCRYTLILSDEQAKANVNALLERTDKPGTEARIRDALTGSGMGNSILLRAEPIQIAPTQSTSRPAQVLGPPPWITGFGQVFNDVPPQRLLAGAGAAPVEQLTCWGNGAINIMRISDRSLRLATAPLLSSIETSRLIDARNAAFAPQARARKSMLLGVGNNAVTANADAVTNLLAEARVDPKVRRTIAFTSISTCFSLWVVTQDAQRTWYRFYVTDDSNPRNPRVDAFAW